MFLVAQAGQLFGDTEAAALPSLLESGRLPARISGLPASGRALLAASMHAQLDAPVLAVCPDEAAAELFQKDLTALLGQDVPLLTARDYTFYTVESVSRQTEQKRLSALYALAAGTAPAVVCTVSGLLLLTSRPLKTWFPFGSVPIVLNLASKRNSPDRSTKSTRLCT